MNSDLTNLLLFCDVQTFCAGGRGGQHQNKTESAVRIVHRPTGMTVICRDRRSQYLNKLRCLEILQRKIARRNEKPKPRIPTTISFSKKIKRLEKKRRQGAKKKNRRRPEIED